MNEQTEKLVRELAEKLGTTVEHLWEVLIRQASITAISNGITIAILSLIIFATYYFIKIKTKCPQQTQNDPYPSPEWDVEIAALAWFVFGLITLFASIFIMCGIYEIITCLLNPEYWALKQVIR